MVKKFLGERWAAYRVFPVAAFNYLDVDYATGAIEPRAEGKPASDCCIQRGQMIYALEKRVKSEKGRSLWYLINYYVQPMDAHRAADQDRRKSMEFARPIEYIY